MPSQPYATSGYPQALVTDTRDASGPQHLPNFRRFKKAPFLLLWFLVTSKIFSHPSKSVLVCRNRHATTSPLKHFSSFQLCSSSSILISKSLSCTPSHRYCMLVMARKAFACTKSRSNLQVLAELASVFRTQHYRGLVFSCFNHMM
jgi:hypothetical protein